MKPLRSITITAFGYSRRTLLLSDPQNFARTVLRAGDLCSAALAELLSTQALPPAEPTVLPKLSSIFPCLSSAFIPHARLTFIAELN